MQPLIAKYILPWFGGGAAVWTTCMLFFQTVLLAGYLYAHLGVSRLGRAAQAAVHVLCCSPPLRRRCRRSCRPRAGSRRQKRRVNPTWRILLLLAATVGLPCVALAATSPLLHAWYSRAAPGAAVYRLYALSNVGSLLALLAYPFVVEPLAAAARAGGGVVGRDCACSRCCAPRARVLAARHAARGFARDRCEP